MSNATRPGVVLVAELDQTVRMVTVDLLEDAGFQVLTACSVEEVMQEISNTREINVLICGRSIQQQGDVIQLAHHIHELCPSIRVIVTSGAGNDVRQALPPRVKFLQKPYSYDTLLCEVAGRPFSTASRTSSTFVIPESVPVLAGVSASVGIGLAAAPVANPDKT